MSRFAPATYSLLVVLLAAFLILPQAAASSLPRVASEDQTLVWMARQLGFSAQHLAAPTEDSTALRPQTLDIEIFLSADPEAVSRWQTLIDRQGLDQSVLRVPPAERPNPRHGFRHQLLALACLAGDRSKADALWRAVTEGRIQIPAGDPMARPDSLQAAGG